MTPDAGLTDGQTVRVTVTGLDAFEGQPVALTQCGNATTAGAPLDPVTEADCFGAEAIGTKLLLGSVSGGTYETDYVVTRTGIGVNRAACTVAANPCVIAVADVITQGGALELTAPIAFAGAAPPPTTTIATEVLSGATGTLPHTGFGQRGVVLIVVAALLLEAGWLLTTGARPLRRRAR